MKDEALSERFDRIPCLIADNPICPRRPASFRIRYERGACIFQRACTVCFVQLNRCPLSDVEPFNFLESCIYPSRRGDSRLDRGREKVFLHRETVFFFFFSLLLGQKGNRRVAFLRGGIERFLDPIASFFVGCLDFILAPLVLDKEETYVSMVCKYWL